MTLTSKDGMKVSGIGAGSGPTESRKADKAGKAQSGAFARHLAQAGGANEPVPVEGTGAISVVDAVLAAQAMGDALDREQRRQFIARGETLLDRLDELRHGLLLGTISKERLTELANLVRDRTGACADPRLAAVLDEIELRVEVELAKLGMAG